MRRRGGFTIIELLVVVAVIGVIVAIAIPNLLHALQRGRQKRTMGEIRSIALANEAYSVDNDAYVVGGPDLLSAAPHLEPTYIAKLPRADAWQYLVAYESDGAAYRVASLGSDGAPGGGGGPTPSGVTTDYRDDIVLADGQFVQFPDGAQR